MILHSSVLVSAPFLLCIGISGNILEFHNTPETWYDALKICQDGLGALITDHFQEFWEVKQGQGITDGKIWTGLYWRYNGVDDFLLDTDCQLMEDENVDSSHHSNQANSSHGCVFMDYTSSLESHFGHCETKLPFVCLSENVLQSATYSRFYFNDGFQNTMGITINQCRNLCLQETSLPCRSLIFTGTSCMRLPNKFSLGTSAAWNVNWAATTTFHYIREAFTEKFSSTATGSVLNNLDSDASEIGSSSESANCQMKCAWSNNLCTCADYENGTCRFFDNPSFCLSSLLVTSNSPDAQVFIKPSGDHTALYINTEQHSVSGAEVAAPQLNCPIPTPLIPSSSPEESSATPSSSPEESSATPSSSPEQAYNTDMSVESTVPDETTIVSTLLDAYSEINTDWPITPTASLASVTASAASSDDVTTGLTLSLSSEFSDLSSVDNLETYSVSEIDILFSSAPKELLTLASDDATPELERTVVTSTEIETLLFSHDVDVQPSDINLLHNTYFISQSGNLKSSKFECDVIPPAASLANLVTFTTFECKFVALYTRGPLANDSSFIEKVVENLSIDKTEISSYKRKYVSAHDGRTSARNVGILGITTLAVVFGGLLLLDLSTLKRDMELLLDNIKS